MENQSEVAGAKVKDFPHSKTRQRRPDMQLYVPRGRATGSSAGLQGKAQGPSVVQERNNRVQDCSQKESALLLSRVRLHTSGNNQIVMRDTLEAVPTLAKPVAVKSVTTGGSNRDEDSSGNVGIDDQHKESEGLKSASTVICGIGELDSLADTTLPVASCLRNALATTEAGSKEDKETSNYYEAQESDLGEHLAQVQHKQDVEQVLQSQNAEHNTAQGEVVDMLCSPDVELSGSGEIAEFPYEDHKGSSLVVQEQASTEESAVDKDSWDVIFDDSGECLDPTVLQELTQALGEIEVKHAELDYTKFEITVPELTEEEYNHILELYDFPAEFETKDLVLGLSSVNDPAFSIKWVDDTHALAVFSSPMAASQALAAQTPLLKIRQVSEASKQSKLKVKRCAEFLQPFKPRPQTSASVARRLVSGALGLRVKVEPEQRRRELQAIKEAKNRRREKVKQQRDIWNGDVS